MYIYIYVINGKQYIIYLSTVLAYRLCTPYHRITLQHLLQAAANMIYISHLQCQGTNRRKIDTCASSHRDSNPPRGLVRLISCEPHWCHAVLRGQPLGYIGKLKHVVSYTELI